MPIYYVLHELACHFSNFRSSIFVSCLMSQSLFKKYLSYEKSQGDKEWIEYVKRKVKGYVEAAVA